MIFVFFENLRVQLESIHLYFKQIPKIVRTNQNENFQSFGKKHNKCGNIFQKYFCIPF